MKFKYLRYVLTTTKEVARSLGIRGLVELIVFLAERLLGILRGSNCNNSLVPATDLIKTKPVDLRSPRVSIIIPTRDRLKLLRKCVTAVFEVTDYENYEVIIVDNGSSESETLAYLKELQNLPNVEVIQDNGDFNFSRLNNAAAKRAKGDVLVLLNNDVQIVSTSWLQDSLGILSIPSVGVVGIGLKYLDGTIQHVGVDLWKKGSPSHIGSGLNFTEVRGAQDICYAEAVTAAAMLTPKELYLKINGLDESLAVGLNDIDYCMKAKSLGYTIVCNNRVFGFHIESATRGNLSTRESFVRAALEILNFRLKWRYSKN